MAALTATDLRNRKLYSTTYLRKQLKSKVLPVWVKNLMYAETLRRKREE